MELRKEVESLLFSSGKLMKEKELAELTNHSEKDIKEALEALKKEYDERDTSLVLMNSGDSWKLNVREKYMGLVTKIIADTELPFPLLETLGVIAFKAPVMQADIVKARGTNAYEHVGLLVDEGFIDKKKEGRSFKLSLTSKFFEYFDVAGHEGIQEALKDAKVPMNKPEQVGKLEVVDLPPGEVEAQKEKDKSKLGEFEVVDVPPEQPKDSIDTVKPDNGFLDDIDRKIAELSNKNDELDEDESFKRPEDLTAANEMQAGESDEAETSDKIDVKNQEDTDDSKKAEENVKEEDEEGEAEEGDEESDDESEEEKEK